MVDRKEIKTLLEREIKKTTEAIRDYKSMSGPVAPDDAIGRVSRMDAINNQSITEAALRHAEQKLTKLRHMLDKIHDPEFGLCARCANQIPLARLVLKPESPFCVRCAG